MTEHEDLLRQEAQRRGWVIEVQQNRMSVGEVPYRKKNGKAGKCRIWVETENDEVSMKAPANGGGANHAVTLSGVEEGCAYQRTGEPVGNVLWTDKLSECVISIKLDEGEYVNGWHALVVYAGRVVGELGAEEQKQVDRIFKFPIAGEDDRDMQIWRDRARGQGIGIVGLGGVGLWILDLMSKTDVREIKIWDGDEIEGRNLLRAPGWASQEAIGRNKAEYFGEQYGRIRSGISIRGENWHSDTTADTLAGLDFVFIAIDKTKTREVLCKTLEEKGIPFIDVGMGIERRNGRVRGSCQVFFSGKNPGRWRQGIPTAEGVGEQEYYALQLADLGALNAALAVGEWRRHIEQYEEEKKDWLIRYRVENNDLLKKSEQP